MKSMFSMGFFSNDMFHSAGPYLGQVTMDVNDYLSSIGDAQNKLNQVNSWVQSHPNYAQLLGGQASYFQDLYNRSQSDASVVTNVQMALSSADPTTGHAGITQGDKDTTDAFISEVNQMLGIIQSAPATPTPGTPAAPGVPPSGLPGLINSFLPKPAAKPGTPVPVPASGISTPLLVGGGILGIGLIVLLVKG